MLHSGKSATILPSIAASSSGHWNHDASRRWQRAIVPPSVEPHMGEDVAAERLDEREALDRPLPAPGSAARSGPAGQARQHRFDQLEALADLLDPDPDARVDVALAPRPEP